MNTLLLALLIVSSSVVSRMAKTAGGNESQDASGPGPGPGPGPGTGTGNGTANTGSLAPNMSERVESNRTTAPPLRRTGTGVDTAEPVT